MSDLIGKKELLGAVPPPPVFAEVAGVGRVGVRVMTALERDRLGAALEQPSERDFRRAWIVRYGTCAADGRPLFADAEVVAISGMSGLVVDQLVSEIVAVNRMGGGDIEDAAKNSESGPSAA